MTISTPPTEAEIREQAYYFWEQDGRPFGRDHEYWERAAVALTEKVQMDMLTALPPKKAAKPKTAALKAPPKLKSGASKSAKPASAVKPKAAPKLKSAASKAKPAPAKTAKVEPKAKKK